MGRSRYSDIGAGGVLSGPIGAAYRGIDERRLLTDFNRAEGGSGVGYCKCGRPISKNKNFCLDCAWEVAADAAVELNRQIADREKLLAGMKERA